MWLEQCDDAPLNPGNRASVADNLASLATFGSGETRFTSISLLNRLILYFFLLVRRLALRTDEFVCPATTPRYSLLDFTAVKTDSVYSRLPR